MLILSIQVFIDNTVAHSGECDGEYHARGRGQSEFVAIHFELHRLAVSTRLIFDKLGDVSAIKM